MVDESVCFQKDHPHPASRVSVLHVQQFDNITPQAAVLAALETALI